MISYISHIVFASMAIVMSMAITTPLLAQENEEKDCGEVLNEARRYFDLGQIEKVPKTLDKCMKGGFDKSQKSEAYELMVLTYQYDNKPFKAEETYIDLLKHDPEYEISRGNTPYELVRLYETYHAPPVYAIGIIGGVNSAFGQRIQSYGLGNAEKEETQYGGDGLGIQVGLTVERYISNRINLNLDIMYNNIRYKRSLSQLGFADINYVEDQRQIKVPLTATYDFGLGQFSPFVRLGGGITYMFSSEATVERIYQENDLRDLPDVTGPPINILGQRNNVNFFSTIGAGVNFKIPRGKISLDVRHNWYFLQQNRPSKRYENNVLVYEYHYIDDDFKLGNIAVSLGYTYSFHKIKLIKNRQKVTNSEE